MFRLMSLMIPLLEGLACPLALHHNTTIATGRADAKSGYSGKRYNAKNI